MTDITRRQMIANAAVVAAVGAVPGAVALAAETPVEMTGYEAYNRAKEAAGNRFGFSFYFEVKGDQAAARQLHAVIQRWFEERNDPDWPSCEQIFFGSSKVEAIDPPSDPPVAPQAGTAMPATRDGFALYRDTVTPSPAR